MVSYEVSFLCGALSMLVGAGSVVASEQVHPGCIHRQREPCVKAFTSIMLISFDTVRQILKGLLLISFVPLGVACGSALTLCLPAALCLLGFVRCMLALIECVRRKCVGSGNAKQPKKWSPATPRATKRKAQLRERRLIKQATRHLARCLRQIHREH